MWGAIIGDIIGSTFEYENHRSPFFELFRKDARFTDDTVCTVAVADILQKMNTYMPSILDENTVLNHDWVSLQMRIWCCTYLNRGFGSMFYQWIANGVNKPYNSFGNGALMRISPVALYAIKNNWSLEKALIAAKNITDITHNHPEAQRAVKCYITILYNILKDKLNIQSSKELIKNTLIEFKYNLPEKIEKYRVIIEFDLTCETSLLIACAGILEANDFEEVFHLVVSCGGDSDTYCAIAGAIAEAVWGIDNKYLLEIQPYFREYDQDLLKVMNHLYIS